MTGFASVNLLRLFDFYLAAAALLSFARRYPVYWDAVRLTVVLRGRWPRLFERLRVNHGVIVTRDVVRPVAVALAVMGVQLVCSRVIWPKAVLPAGLVWDSWWRLVLTTFAAVPVLYVDGYFLIRVGRFDRRETEKYLDEAERWLRGWKAPAVWAATFGYVNPRRMVDDEVRKGMTALGQMVSWSMWWVTAQVTCRVLFGLTLWFEWAVG